MSNIGVGTSNPAYPLDVTGDLNFTGTLRKGGVAYIGSQWSNNSTSVFLLNSNVGIGTSAPSEALEVTNSNAKIGSNLYVMSRIGVGKSNPTIAIDINGGMNATNNISTSGGYIGILTTSPSYPLDINTTTSLNSYIRNRTDFGREAGMHLERSNSSGWTAWSITNLGTGYGSRGNTLNIAYNVTSNVMDMTLSNTYFYSPVTLSRGVTVGGNVTLSNFGSNFIATSNTNIGIGTSNPSYTLDVSGDLNFTGTLRQGGVPYLATQWSNFASNVFLLSSNVALGKSNANAMLDVVGTVNIGNVLTVASNIVPLSNLVYDIGTSNMRFRSLYLASNTIDLGGTKLTVQGGTLAVLDSNSSNVPLISQSLQLGITSNSVVTLSGSNGCLGINNSNPLTTVDIVGTTSFRGNIQMNNAVAIRGLTVYKRDGTMANITTSSVQGLSNDNAGIILSVASNNANVNFRFVANTTEVARITGAGNIGIGTSNPGCLLAVAGGHTVGAAYSNVVPPTNGLLVQGNTGIGTLNPGYNLDVTGITRITSNVIIGTGTSTLTFAPGMFFNGSTFVACNNAMSIDLPNTGVVTFGDNVLFTGGNVGIGTTSPNCLLAVAGGHTVGATYSNVVPPTNGLLVQGNTGIGTSNPGSLLSIAGGTAVGAAYSNVAAPVNGLLVQGNVGIGNITPSYVLDVNGPMRVNSIGNTSNKLLVLFDAGVSDNISTACNFYGFGINPFTFRYQAPPLGTHNFYIGPTSIMTLSNTSVGIGTINPAYTLDVNGGIRSTATYVGGTASANVNWAFNYTSITSTSSSVIFGSNNNTNASAEILFAKGTVDTSNILRIGFYNNNSLLNVMANGNVGIGTVTPGYMLDVNGTIRLNAAMSAGTNKLLVLYDQGGVSDNVATACNFYGLGINPYVLRYQVPVLTTHNFYIGPTSVMTLSNTNVGIGTINPAYPLDVSGIIKSTQGYCTSSTTGPGRSMGNVTFTSPSACWVKLVSIQNCSQAKATYRVVGQIGCVHQAHSIDVSITQYSGGSGGDPFVYIHQDTLYGAASKDLFGVLFDLVYVFDYNGNISNLYAICYASAISLNLDVYCLSKNTGGTPTFYNNATYTPSPITGSIKSYDTSLGSGAVQYIASQGANTRYVNVTDYTGYVGIGTSNPAFPLNVESTGTLGGQINVTMPIIGSLNNRLALYGNTNGVSLHSGTNASQAVLLDGTNNQFRPWADNVTALGSGSQRWATVCAANGTIQTSDETLKVSTPLPYGLCNLLNVSTIMYQWKTQSNLPDDDPTKNYKYYGVCANELATLFPELVYNDSDIAQLNYSELIPIIINAVKDLNSNNIALVASNATMATEINNIKSFLAATYSNFMG